MVEEIEFGEGEHGLSIGRVESVGAKVCLITRIAFGFRAHPMP